eukprot:1156035-Pelagomonas_calceolata.AAC.2
MAQSFITSLCQWLGAVRQGPGSWPGVSLLLRPRFAYPCFVKGSEIGLGQGVCVYTPLAPEAVEARGLHSNQRTASQLGQGVCASSPSAPEV